MNEMEDTSQPDFGFIELVEETQKNHSQKQFEQAQKTCAEALATNSDTHSK